MLGIVVILGVSWLLLYFIQKENLAILGFFPIKKRLLQFGLGLLFIFLVRLLFVFIETKIHSSVWVKNSNFEWILLLKDIQYHFISALTEDLVFRGAILYILIKRLGRQWGIFISAAAFGVYHWFSYGMLDSRWIELALVFLGTGFTGYVWAFTFAKSKSIFLALGFHLAWNLCSSFFFPSQPFGELIYQETSRTDLVGWSELFFYLFNNFAPSLMTFIFVKALLKRNYL